VSWAPDARRAAVRTELRRAREKLDAVVPEKEFQDSVVELALTRRWRVWHDNDSRRNAAGLPDLLLVRPPRVVFAELKAERGRLSAEQERWQEELGRCPGVEVHVWRPSDWDEIERTLR
jgi:hypothetical protein